MGDERRETRAGGVTECWCGDPACPAPRIVARRSRREWAERTDRELQRIDAEWYRLHFQAGAFTVLWPYAFRELRP